MSNKFVYVVGAGITGLLTAYELVKRGYEVHVLEQERYSAQKCSYANGGQSSVSNSEVWTTIPNIKRGLSWTLKKDAPLYISPTISIDKLKWLSKFVYNTLSNVYEENTIKTIQMGLSSQALYEELIQEEQIEFDRLQTGILHFYRDQKYFEHAKSVKHLFNSNGCEWDLLSTEEVLDLENKLTPSTILGGVYTKSDWTGDIYKFCSDLTSILKSKYNVRFHYRCPLTSIDFFDSKVVVCAGIGSKRLAKTVGDSLDIYPVKGYSITITVDDPSTLPQVSLLDDEHKIVTATFGNRFRVAGTAELVGENYDISRHRIDLLLNWVRDTFPEIDCSTYSQWACLRPMTPNMMPIVKQSSKKKNIYYNTGHGHLGWTLAPHTANQVVNLIER